MTLSMKIKTNLTIIIPTMDREEILFESLHHLNNAIQDYNVEVLIINDSKTKKLVLPKYFSTFKVLNNPGQGVASARNFGSSKANSEIIWFLDDDIWIDQNVLERGLDLINLFPDSIFNFNWIYPDYLNKQIVTTPFGRYLEKIEFTTMKGWSRGNYWDDFNLFKTRHLAGATLLLKKSTYESVDGYNGSFPLAGFEDSDFSNRVVAKHIECYIDPQTVVYHNEINKTNLRGFLKRVFNNSITRRHAVSIGYLDQKMYFSNFKKNVYENFKYFEIILLFLCDYWPNVKKIDKFYFLICRLLISYNNYKGYTYKD